MTHWDHLVIVCGFAKLFVASGAFCVIFYKLRLVGFYATLPSSLVSFYWSVNRKEFGDVSRLHLLQRAPEIPESSELGL